MSSCKYCSSLKVIKFGFRMTKERGSIHRYKCKTCGRTYVIDDGFYHRHKSKRLILDTLHLQPKLSYRELADHFNISKNTPWAWVKYYTLKLMDFLKFRVPQSCDYLHMDELFLKMKNTFYYLWDSVSKDTRFTFWFLAPCRTREYAKRLMKLSPTPTELLITDGAFSYMRPIKEYYGLRFYYSKYHRCESFEDKKDNNLIERVQNTLRRYLHLKRGFFNLKTGNINLKFLWIYYNFVRNHSTIKCTPAEKAGVICFFGLKNEKERLMKIIELSFLIFLMKRNAVLG